MEISNEALRQIANLASRQRDLEQQVADAEHELKAVKESLRAVQEDLLPSAMAEAGVKSFELEDGSKITIKSDMTLSIPKEKKGEALRWLVDNGYGDLVKHEVSVGFGRGQEDDAQKLYDFATSIGYSASDTVDVNSTTLKAFVKEQLSQGVDMPLELFGAFPYTKAIIK